jgi:hypothetical protein
MIKKIPKEIFKVFSGIEWLMLAPILAVKILAKEIHKTAGQNIYPRVPIGRFVSV